MTGQLQLPAPTGRDAIPPDLGPGECRWACWGYDGPETREDLPDGRYILRRPVRQIGWVRGRRYDPGINGVCPLRD